MIAEVQRGYHGVFLGRPTTGCPMIAEAQRGYHGVFLSTPSEKLPPIRY
jgi:hypothetical protein